MAEAWSEEAYWQLLEETRVTVDALPPCPESFFRDAMDPWLEAVGEAAMKEDLGILREASATLLRLLEPAGGPR